MKNPFELFKHPKFGEIRVILLNDEPFKPWFVAVDVCRALEIKNPTMALERLEDDEKMTLSLSEMTLSSTEGHSSKRGGARFLNIINEPGFYRLVFASRKKEALEFQRWVYHEVLPSIRFSYQRNHARRCQKNRPGSRLFAPAQRRHSLNRQNRIQQKYSRPRRQN